ncbi:hypothetical protein GQ53DRAFT_137811 [Thozetella sp. PMI_491]|nr:hypothetical protein GQ53DRAFT_137811 [Thozetella sp. PMI_491]
MAGSPVTTLFPLTGCFANCGPLYDANGACVPPAAPTADASSYDSCFCNNAVLKAFSTGTAGVCDNQCTGTDAATGLATIQSWYTSFCANIGQAAVETTGTGTGTTAGSTGTSSASTGNSSGGGGGTWISTHYQWVIFLIIMVLAIAGIWVGACIWRRKYLAKRDRQYALGKNLARATESGRIVPNASQAGSIHVPGAGMFMPAPISSAGVYGQQEKEPKTRNKWTVSQRT